MAAFELRPLTTGEILDGGITLMRRQFGVLFGIGSALFGSASPYLNALKAAAVSYTFLTLASYRLQTDGAHPGEQVFALVQ